MRLIDVHTHIQFAAFTEDWEETIKRSLAVDTWLINSGTQKNTSKKAVDIAERYAEGVYATVGLHPIHTGTSVYDLQELGDSGEGKITAKGEEFDYDYYRRLSKHPKVVAIGECGLDFAVWVRKDGKKQCSAGEIEEIKEKQKAVFIRQIELAGELKKPIIVHCRDAYPELIKILKDSLKSLPDSPGVIHFFSGNEEEARELLEMGFCFSFGGIITFAERYAELVRLIPLEKILLETDAPYVTPAPFRGKRNEPAYLIYVAQKVAEIKKEEVEEVGRITTETAVRLFNLF
jgi:TatD DNase family protein